VRGTLLLRKREKARMRSSEGGNKGGECVLRGGKGAEYRNIQNKEAPEGKEETSRRKRRRALQSRKRGKRKQAYQKKDANFAVN